LLKRETEGFAELFLAQPQQSSPQPDAAPDMNIDRVGIAEFGPTSGGAALTRSAVARGRAFGQPCHRLISTEWFRARRSGTPNSMAEAPILFPRRPVRGARMAMTDNPNDST
jgi:hypothetical protein